jgi:SAM-dependent methyltransferase
MNHADHVQLLRAGVVDQPKNPVWADFGSGTGAFTLALADVLSAGEIYSIDRDRGALQEQARVLAERFPTLTLRPLVADFTKPLELPPLDGIVMANALHFIQPAQRGSVLTKLRSYLKPNMPLLLVEYNVDRGNTWVPYPFSFGTWQKVAEAAGFRATRQLGHRPSRFLGEIYSAISFA